MKRIKNFNSFINTSNKVNSSLIVNQFLNPMNLSTWTIAGLFGDNLDNVALKYCKKLCLTPDHISMLSDIGKLVNYNSYGKNYSDLIENPITILEEARMYKDPIRFYCETSIVNKIRKQLDEDFELSLSYYNGENIIFLPNTCWALRIYGILGSYISNNNKEIPRYMFFL
jgi:hypothetical protein